jgi:16S rRNA (uracil1498-N3)-methyltransferase
MSKDIFAVIGPEGGWTDIEIAGFREHGWQPVSLGPRILRAETAAICVASVVNAWLGS